MEDDEILYRWQEEMRSRVAAAPGKLLRFQLADIMKGSGARVTDETHANELWTGLAGALQAKGLVLPHPSMGRGPVDLIQVTSKGADQDNWL